MAEHDPSGGCGMEAIEEAEVMGIHLDYEVPAEESKCGMTDR